MEKDIFRADTSHVQALATNYVLCYILKKSLSNFGFIQSVDKQQLTNSVFNTVQTMQGVKK